jgi:Holliday junction resolvase RusA-like endonuclease
MLITLNVVPVAKGRAKTHFINGQAITYTPKTTRHAQDEIISLIQQYREAVTFEANVPIKLTVVFYRLKSIWLKGSQKKETMPVRKPDLDNFIKLLLDSINTILIKDDSQITSIDAKKSYSKTGSAYIQFELSEDKDD